MKFLVVLFLSLGLLVASAAPQPPIVRNQITTDAFTNGSPGLAPFSIDGTNIGWKIVLSEVNTQTIFFNYIITLSNFFGNIVYATNFTIVSNFVFNGDVITNINQTGDTNWIDDGVTLRPQTAGTVTVTNLSVWDKLIAKGAFITETRSRTLVLGSNCVDALTNSFLLLDSPTNDASLVTVFLRQSSSSGQELTILANSPGGAFTLIDGSALCVGGGNLYLQGDFVANGDGRGLFLKSRGSDWIEVGRFDVSNSAPASVNPTIGFIPFNQDGVSFGDSSFLHVSAASTVMTNGTGAVVGLSFVSTNGTGSVGITGAGGTLELLSPSGAVNVSAGNANLFLTSGTNAWRFLGKTLVGPSNLSGSNTFNIGNDQFPFAKVTTHALEILPGAVAGYVWTATNTAGLGAWQPASGGAGGSSIWTNIAGQYSPTEANAQGIRFGSNTANSALFSVVFGIQNTNGSIALSSVIGGGTNNWTLAPHSVIAGGEGNQIGSNAIAATLSGGSGNIIDAFTPDWSVIAGGQLNRVRELYGTVSGGAGNDAQGIANTIAGGINHLATRGDYITISGGQQNTARGDWAMVGGGTFNNLSAAADGSDGAGSGIASGGRNTVGSGGTAGASYSFIGGGRSNLVMDLADYSILGGGSFNQVGGGGNPVIGNFLGGGFNNLIGDQTDYAVIGGGRRNTITTADDFGQILGGQSNRVTSPHGIVIAGYSSEVTASNAVVIGSTTTNSTPNSVAIPVGVFPLTNALAGQVMTSAGGVNGQMYWATASGGAGDGTGPFTNSVGTISNSVAGSNFVFTAYTDDASQVVPWTLRTSDVLSQDLLHIENEVATRWKFHPFGGLSMGQTNGGGTLDGNGVGTLAMGESTGTGSFLGASGIGTLVAGQALNGGDFSSTGVGSASVGFANTGGVLSSTLWASFTFASATNGTASSTARGALAGGIAENANLSTSGDAGFTWGRNVENSGANAFAYGNNFTNSTANTFNVGWNALQFRVNETNGVATPNITAHGLVSAAWQLGNATNNVSVLVSATNHATATINGVKIAIPYALMSP